MFDFPEPYRVPFDGSFKLQMAKTVRLLLKPKKN